MMAVSMETEETRRIWDSVRELTKLAQERASDPPIWALQISSSLTLNGVSLPSHELATLLVSYICWDNNVPALWKFLDKALALRIVPPLLLLALLSERIIPCRRSRPVAYRLYMELLKRHAFDFEFQLLGAKPEQVIKSIDAALNLSENFGIEARDHGVLVVEFVFSVVWQLLDAALDDESLLELSPEKQARLGMKHQEMDVDDCNDDDKRIEHLQKLQNMNTSLAIEAIGKFLQNRVTSQILHLARRNLPTHWIRFIQRLRLLGANSSALRNSTILTADDVLRWTSDTQVLLTRETKMCSSQHFHAAMAFGSLVSSSGLCHGATSSALWLPLDLALEDAMDGYQVNATSAIELVTGLVKTLQAINGNTWHDTFLSLWIAALRLVQRERNPIEGPIPRLDTRLCMLLSVIPLVIADLIEEDETVTVSKFDFVSTNHWKEKHKPGRCRNDFVSSLQLLGDYQELLSPPQSVVSAANQAAAVALLFASGFNVGSSYFECMSMKDMPSNCAGNLRHLIVEACIARNLLDTSAYFWPGYVNGRISQIPHSLPTQVPGWSSFMKGAPLTNAMISALASNPASRLKQLNLLMGLMEA